MLAESVSSKISQRHLLPKVSNAGAWQDGSSDKKALAMKPDGLSLTPGTHVAEGKSYLLQAVLTSIECARHVTPQTEN